MKNARVVSLFSGGGGLDLGFLRAEYDIIWAIDNDKNAVDTYSANIGKHILCMDLNDITDSELPKCDIVIGGPPCQSFSLAGKRNADDKRGRLIWKYLDVIECLQPRAFLFENVTGLLSAKNYDGDKVLPLLSKAFHNLGYSINVGVINALDFGVPQRRKRLFIVGIKGQNPFVFPKQTHGDESENGTKYVSVADALDDLPAASSDMHDYIAYEKNPKTEYQLEMRTNSQGVTEHFIPTMSSLDEYIITHVKPGGNYMDIPTDVPSKRIRRLQRYGGHTTCYGRLAGDSPSYTINTYFNRPNVGCNIHYKESRLITVREALRLQSFPDTFIIVSSNKHGRNSIVGNAVPPKVATVLAEALKHQIA